MNPRDPKTCLLIIPLFDQVHEVGTLLRKLRHYYSRQNVIVVDDGSTDGSAELVERLGYSVIRHKTNKGIGAAIRTGIRYGQKHQYDFACIFSSNGKMRPEDIHRVVRPLYLRTARYVKGSRFCSGGESVRLPPFRYWSIKLLSALASLLTGAHTTDITCGFRAFEMSLLQECELNLEQNWLDTYEMEYHLHLAFCKNTEMMEVPVTIDYSHLSVGRMSKIKLARDGWRILVPFAREFLSRVNPIPRLARRCGLLAWLGRRSAPAY